MYLMVNAFVISSLMRMVTSEVIRGIVRTLERTVSLLKDNIGHIVNCVNINPNVRHITYVDKYWVVIKVTN